MLVFNNGQWHFWISGLNAWTLPSDTPSVVLDWLGHLPSPEEISSQKEESETMRRAIQDATSELRSAIRFNSPCWDTSRNQKLREILSEFRRPEELEDELISFVDEIVTEEIESITDDVEDVIKDLKTAIL